VSAVVAGDRAMLSEPTWHGLPRVVATTVWTNLPLLLALDLCLAVAAVPTLATVLMGGYLLAPLVAAVTWCPLWAAVAAVSDRLVRGDAVSLAAVGTAVRRHAGRGLRLGIVAATAGTAFLGTVAILSVNPDQGWLLVPLAADGAVLVLLLLAGFTAFSLSTSGGLRGWVLVRAAPETVAANRMATAGTLALLLLLGGLVTWIPGAVAVLPAPLAVYLSAWTMTATARRADGTTGGTGR
jgi:hypothetical protein